MNLPEETIQFLKSNTNYKWTFEETGEVILKTFEEVEEEIEEFHTCYSNDEIEELDPFHDLNMGTYHVPVINLVKETTHYGSEGILTWFPKLQKFGSYDSEHSTVLTWNVTWQDILKFPEKYITDLFSSDYIGTEELLWLNYDFIIEEADYTFESYGELCPLHKTKLETLNFCQSPKKKLLKLRHIEPYSTERLKHFPNSGLPISKSKLHACKECYEAEQVWLDKTEKHEQVPTLTPSSNGWVTCPYCEIKFKVTDINVYEDGRHYCGQKIKLGTG